MANMDVNALKAQLGTPQRDFLWEIVVPAPIGGGDVETFQLRAQSTKIPSREQGQIKIPFKQTPGIKVPGKVSFEDTWTCTFIEGEDHKVRDAMVGWMDLIVNPTTGTGTGDSSIKTDIYLNLLTVVGGTATSIKLKGCYIKGLGSINLAFSSEDTVKYEVTFSFDSIEEA